MISKNAFTTFKNLNDIEHCNLLNQKGKIYIRGNKFEIEDISQFNQQFKLTEKSKEKTVQNITNCKDALESDMTTRFDSLNYDEYQGLYPCFELNKKSYW